MELDLHRFVKRVQYVVIARQKWGESDLTPGEKQPLKVHSAGEPSQMIEDYCATA